MVKSYVVVLCTTGGLSLPTERWTEIMTEVNSKTEALHIEYETICIENKVRIFVNDKDSCIIHLACCKSEARDKDPHASL